jgi:hypothetical protein
MMARASKKRSTKGERKSRVTTPSALLKGWQQIASFLSQPVSVAQRWAKTGMPVTRQGRYVTATPEDLEKGLGREAGGEPLHVSTPESDLAAELRRGLTYVRGQLRESRESRNRK